MNDILLIEDDAWLADSYQRILERADLKVAVAPDAESAMRIVDEHMPRVIVADVMLAGHTIFGLLHELQSYDDTSKIPVVLCSNLDKAVLSGSRLMRYGVHTVLEKTEMTPERLVQVVRDIL